MLVLYSSLGIIKIKDTFLYNFFISKECFYISERDFRFEFFFNNLLLLINYGYIQRYRIRGLGYRQKHYNGDLLQIKLRYSHVMFRYLPYSLLTYSKLKKRTYHTIYGFNKSLVNQYIMLWISFRVANIYTKKGFFKKYKLVNFKKKAKRDKNRL